MKYLEGGGFAMPAPRSGTAVTGRRARPPGGSVPALTMTGAIPYHVVALHHAAALGLSGNVNLGGEVELQSGLGGFIITHDGSVEITR